MIRTIKIETPLGEMIAGATEEGICLLEFSDRRMLNTEYKDLSKRLKTSLEEGDNKHFKKLRPDSVRADGRLTGYGGGLKRKKWLLDHERKYSGIAVEMSLF